MLMMGQRAETQHQYYSLERCCDGMIMMKIVSCCCLRYAIISSQEHELLSEQLERAQKKMLRVSKDRSFLLDRMLQYEKVVDSSSDSDATDVSDSDTEKPASKYVF